MVRRKSLAPSNRREASTPKTSKLVRNVDGQSPNISSQDESKISQKASTPSLSKPKKPKRYRPGALPLKEIRVNQKSTSLSIPKLPFSRLVREIMENLSGNGNTPSLRIQSTALEALQEASEQYLVHLFEDANLCYVYARRMKLQVEDIAYICSVVRQGPTLKK